MNLMELSKALSLSHVPRWVIVDTTKGQSVAEHSYNVAVFTIAVWDIIKPYILHELQESDEDFYLAALKLALTHDINESLTGDTPSPAHVSDEDVQVVTFQWVVVRVADYLDAYRFVRRYGINCNKVLDYVDSRLWQWLSELKRRLMSSPPEWVDPDHKQIHDAVQLIYNLRKMESTYEHMDHGE
jgi:hypothetical protein